jgi:hypothetical protein
VRLFLFSLFFTLLTAGGAAAHADTYLFDLHFDPATYQGVTYAASDIVYETDLISPFYGPYPSYYSGDLNGFISGELGYNGDAYIIGEDGNPIYYYLYSSLDPVEGSSDVVGFSVEVLAPTGVGVFPFVPNGGNRLLSSGDPDYPFLVQSDGYLTVTAMTPEPGTWMMVGTGVIGCFGAMVRKRRRQDAVA